MQCKGGDVAQQTQKLLEVLQPLWQGGSSAARKGGKRKRGGSQQRSSKVRQPASVVCNMPGLHFCWSALCYT
jgi:hypothetical protein